VGKFGAPDDRWQLFEVPFIIFDDATAFDGFFG
jgi:hypothetical protein